MEARGLTEDDLLVDVVVMDRAELAAKMAEQDVLISF
jgi:tRNA 2-thiouridine synthesizing protein C